MKLDAILTNARKVTTIPAKKNANQKPLDKMILMEYNCVDIGIVMMTGIPSRFQEHVTGSGM